MRGPDDDRLHDSGACDGLASSVNCASSKRVRVCKGLRSMWSRGISRGLPLAGGASAAMEGTTVAVAAAGREGRRDSRPFPKARRFGSVAVGMVFFLFMSFRSLWPAGRAHCAWGGHFVACIPDWVLLGSSVRPSAGAWSVYLLDFQKRLFFSGTVKDLSELAAAAAAALRRFSSGLAMLLRLRISRASSR